MTTSTLYAYEDGTVSKFRNVGTKNSDARRLPKNAIRHSEMELLLSSETSALKAQTPADYPKNAIRHSTHSESLKSRHGEANSRFLQIGGRAFQRRQNSVCYVALNCNSMELTAS